jgi:transcriptional regulator GlxA family with amidase domain
VRGYTFLRLTELIASPIEQAVLAPLIILELHYRLLQGPLGSQFRMIHTQGSQSYRIARAIQWLKDNYKEPSRVNDLEKMVDMAAATFRKHLFCGLPR